MENVEELERTIVKLIDAGGVERYRDACVLCGELMATEADEVVTEAGEVIDRADNPENVRKGLDYLLLIRKRCADMLKRWDEMKAIVAQEAKALRGSAL